MQYVNHTHDNDCYEGFLEPRLVCEIGNDYKNAFHYAVDHTFDLDYRIINIIAVVGVSEVLAVSILIARVIKNKKMEKEKIYDSVKKYYMRRNNYEFIFCLH